MDKAKDSFQWLAEMQTLLDARKIVRFKSDLDESVADKAEEFLTALNAEMEAEVKNGLNPSELPKKSEMPCNCVKKTLQEIIDEAKGNLPTTKLSRRLCSALIKRTPSFIYRKLHCRV